MTGEIDLKVLLASLNPILSVEEYVFFTPPTLPPLNDSIFACIQESEGWTCILNKHVADQMQAQYETSFKRITIHAHSSLESVGLTAAISTLLAEHDISCNIVAGFYHDHLFVRSKEANQAMELLKGLAQR